MSLYNKKIINKILQITQQDCLEQRKFMVMFECKFVFFSIKHLFKVSALNFFSLSGLRSSSEPPPTTSSGPSPSRSISTPTTTTTSSNQNAIVRQSQTAVGGAKPSTLPANLDEFKVRLGTL